MQKSLSTLSLPGSAKNNMWQVTGDMWHMTHDTWHMTHETWHMTLDTWQMTRGLGWTFFRNISSLALMVWDTHVCGSLEIWRIWRVCVTHSLTLEMETKLCKVSRAMSSVFSCLHRANETLCARCAAYYEPLECKLWFCTGPNNRLSSRAR